MEKAKTNFFDRKNQNIMNNCYRCSPISMSLEVL